MARNIPSLFSLTGNRLYDLGVRSTNLEQYNYPAQLVGRYEDFSRERAALIIQRNERARRDAKAKIINILLSIQTRRRALGISRAEDLVENYNIVSTSSTATGSIITKELGKLDIRDFMNQSFWWKLVKRGLEELRRLYSMPVFVSPQQAQLMDPHSLNSSRLIAIVLRIANNIEQYINAGIINPERDVGVRYIRRKRDISGGFWPRGADPLMVGVVGAIPSLRFTMQNVIVYLSPDDFFPNDEQSIRRMWSLGVGRIGVIYPAPPQANQFSFGRRHQKS